MIFYEISTRWRPQSSIYNDAIINFIIIRRNWKRSFNLKYWWHLQDMSSRFCYLNLKISCILLNFDMVQSCTTFSTVVFASWCMTFAHLHVVGCWLWLWLTQQPYNIVHWSKLPFSSSFSNDNHCNNGSGFNHLNIFFCLMGEYCSLALFCNCFL